MLPTRKLLLKAIMAWWVHLHGVGGTALASTCTLEEGEEGESGYREQGTRGIVKLVLLPHLFVVMVLLSVALRC